MCWLRMAAKHKIRAVAWQINAYREIYAVILLVEFNLRRRSHSYKGFFDALCSFGGWCHPMDSTWLLDTKESPEAVRALLAQYIDHRADTLIVVELKKSRATFNLHKNCVEWLNDTLRSW